MYITKNSISRKLVILSMAFLLFVGSLFTNFNRSAHAMAPAVPLAVGTGAGYAAVGAYVLGGLLVAGGAAYIANDQDRATKIKTSSLAVWNKFNQTQKDVWNSAIDSSIAAGKSTLTFTDSMISDLQSVSSDLWKSAKDLVAIEEVKQLGVITTGLYSYGGADSRYINQVAKKPLNFTINGFTGWYATAQRALISGQYKLNLILYNDSQAILQNWGYIVVTKEAYDAFGASNDYNSLLKALALAGYTVTYQAKGSAMPADDHFSTGVDTAINDLSGVKEVNIPLDQFLAKNATGEAVTYNEATSTVLNPDGSTYTGEVTWDFPIPNVATPSTVGAPAVPISTVNVGDVPFVATPAPPTAGGGTGIGGTNPFNNLVPIAFLAAILDLLRAVLMYLARMFEFILTIPLIPTKTIDNTAFEWFKNANIIGVKIYNVVSTLASIGLSFAVYKAVRRLLP